MAYTMPGNRGGTVLVYNNYRFHKNKVTSTTIHTNEMAIHMMVNPGCSNERGVNQGILVC
jgi:hypothetical protein